MSINKLIECIDLPPEELKKYVHSEIDEFIEAKEMNVETEEFGDILFALRALYYAKTRSHCDLGEASYEVKIKKRLRDYGTISKRISVMPKDFDKMTFGVVHLCFGSFKDPWERFNPLKNGTEAEITVLTDIEVLEKNNYTNHLLVTFDNVDEVKVNLLQGSWRFSERNTVRIQIPDFIFNNSKRERNFQETSELLSLQVMRALDLLTIEDFAIVHFHSWESGFLLENSEFKSWLSNQKSTIFSPYLTVARLLAFMENDLTQKYTLKHNLCKLAAKYELDLIGFCKKTILESHHDYEFYSKKVLSDYIITSFTKKNKIKFKPQIRIHSKTYNFVAGGRPVYEKGFIQLVNSFKLVCNWGENNGINFKLDIYCLDSNQRKDKYKCYINQLEETIKANGLEECISLKNKVSERELEIIISKSAGLIIPSLYDPFCLMPKYAFSSGSPSFISTFTGISESITSSEYLFDPIDNESLLKSIRLWIETNPDFHYENLNMSFVELYLKAN